MWLFLASALAASEPGLPPDGPIPRPEPEGRAVAFGVTASWNAQTYLEAVATSNRTALELAGSARFASGVEVGVGARRLFSPTVAKVTAWEGFVAGRIGPRLGVWSPAVGVELGLTGALQQDWEALEEGFFYESRVNGAVDDVVFGAVGAAPARFRFGPVLAEVMSLSFGSTLPSWGRAVRFEVVALRAGAVF